MDVAQGLPGSGRKEVNVLAAGGGQEREDSVQRGNRISERLPAPGS